MYKNGRKSKKRRKNSNLTFGIFYFPSNHKSAYIANISGQIYIILGLSLSELCKLYKTKDVLVVKN